MTNALETNTRRSILISVDFDMTSEELRDFTEQHLGYVTKARSFHIGWVGDIRVLEGYAGENFCYTVEIDFTEYVDLIQAKYPEMFGEALTEALDNLMEYLVEQMIEGSRPRQDGSRLVEGRPELATMLMLPEYDVTPAPASDAIAEFKANAVSANNVELYEMFLETLEKVRSEERAVADARVEAVEKSSEAKIETMASTLANVIKILSKEVDGLTDKNSHLAELAGLPKFRRTSDTGVVKPKQVRVSWGVVRAQR